MLLDFKGQNEGEHLGSKNVGWVSLLLLKCAVQEQACFLPLGVWSGFCIVLKIYFPETVGKSWLN